MHQLLYISTASPNVPIVTADILRVSRRNNARDAITGLLFFNGQRFLQALEGPEDAITRTIERIRGDTRHRAIVILSQRIVASREFGDWAMASGGGGGGGGYAEEAHTLDRIAALVANAAPNVQATFNSYARLRRAA